MFGLTDFEILVTQELESILVVIDSSDVKIEN